MSLLYGLIGLFQSRGKAPVKKWGLIFGLVFLSCLSVYINTLYDIQNATLAFAKADAVKVFGIPLGTMNPLIGGSFALLNIFYAVLSSLVQSEGKAEMTEEEYEREKTRLQREHELQVMRKSTHQGFLQQGKEALFGREKDTQELLQEAIMFLRTAHELRATEQEERALQALAAHLNIKAKAAFPLLIQARSWLQKEEHEPVMNEDTTADDGEQAPVNLLPSSYSDHLQGRDTVTIEDAAKMLECQPKRIITLRNQGRLKHAPKREDLVTVASLRTYMTARRKRSTPARVPETVGKSG